MAFTNAQQPALERKVRFDWINEAWQLFSAAAGVWIGAAFAYMAAIMVVEFVGMFGFGIFTLMYSRGAAFDPTFIFRQPGYWAVVLTMLLAIAYLGAGFFTMANAQVRGQPIHVGMLFGAWRLTPSMIGYGIVFGICSMLGSILCFLPGYLVLALLGPGYALVADGVPVSEALRRSARAMSGDWLMAWLFAFVVQLLVIVATLVTLGFGAFIALPMLYLIAALVYRDMIGMPAAPGAVYSSAATAAPQPGVWPPPPGAPPYG